jgi:hypothetical protein
VETKSLRVRFGEFRTRAREVRGLVIPTFRDCSVRGSVSCSAEAFPEVPDERLQTQRRYCGRVSEYRPRSLLTKQLVGPLLPSVQHTRAVGPNGA